MTGKKFLIQLFFLIVLSLLFVGSLMPQTQLTISQTIIYDQNIFRNYREIPDWINQTALYLARDLSFKTAHIRLDYTGNLNVFHSYQERLFQIHQLGGQSLLPLNENWRLNVGANYQLRKNKPGYNIYDYSNWLIYSQLRWDKRPSSPVEIGYRFRNRIFTNLAELSYREQFAYLRIKHFFPTKTTFISEISVAAKKYTNRQSIEELIISSADSTGKGRGQRHGKGSGNARADTCIVAYNMNAPATHQWSLKFKIAQSFFSTTGMSLEYIRRFKPTEDTRYLRGQDYSYTKDDELYDDPYTYGSHEWYIVLTQLLPWSSQLKIHTGFYDKNYLYKAAGDLAAGENLSANNRQDQQKLLGLDLSKRFKINKIIQNVSIDLSCYYLKNESNDPYFDFAGSWFSGGIELAF